MCTPVRMKHQGTICFWLLRFNGSKQGFLRQLHSGVHACFRGDDLAVKTVDYGREVHATIVSCKNTDVS